MDLVKAMKLTREALQMLEIPVEHAMILPGHGWRPPHVGCSFHFRLGHSPLGQMFRELFSTTLQSMELGMRFLFSGKRGTISLFQIWLHSFISASEHEAQSEQTCALLSPMRLRRKTTKRDQIWKPYVKVITGITHHGWFLTKRKKIILFRMIKENNKLISY